MSSQNAASMLFHSRNKSAELRSQGKMSCAECRRLRIKCDKNVPCSMCVRRGWENICPHGANTTADGTRHVLAATTGLHDIIASLRDRVRVLESALNSIYLKRTGRTHPLIATSGEVDDAKNEAETSVDELAKLLHDKATLVRGEDGSQRIANGGFDRSWATHAVEQIMFPLALPQFTTHPELARAIRHLPFVPYPPLELDVVSLLRERLPPTQIRDELLSVFDKSVRLFFLPAFTRDYVQEQLIPRAIRGSGETALLALISLFGLLAIGALFAMEGPREAPEVAYYGRTCAEGVAALGPLGSPSIELIEGMYARAMLEFFRQGPVEEPTRCLFAIQGHMCISLGLHRDADSTGLRPEAIERRRLVFWMIYKTDAWQSLAMGRPATIAFNQEYIDVQYCAFGSTSARLDGVLPSFLKVMTVVADIAHANLCLDPPSYADILQLDERVRIIGALRDEDEPLIRPPPSMLLMYLHRTFYVRALTKHPDGPFRSEYAPSVYAVLRGARETITWLQNAVSQAPAMCARLAQFWNMGLNAAMVFKMLLEYAPTCESAPEARAGLKRAMKLFEVGENYGSGRARRALSIFRFREQKIAVTRLSSTSETDEVSNIDKHIKTLKNPLYDMKLPNGQHIPFIHGDRKDSLADLTPPLVDSLLVRNSSREGPSVTRNGVKVKNHHHTINSSFYPNRIPRGRRPLSQGAPTALQNPVTGKWSIDNGHALAVQQLNDNTAPRDDSTPVVEPVMFAWAPSTTQALEQSALSDPHDVPWDGLGWPSMEQGPMHPILAGPDLPTLSSQFGNVDSLNSEWNISWMFTS